MTNQDRFVAELRKRIEIQRDIATSGNRAPELVLIATVRANAYEHVLRMYLHSDREDY